MPAPGITILKHNVPWGPFTRSQIEEGLTRGDFTAEALAHAPGLPDWQPLQGVLEFVDRTHALPPVPAPREHPPIPEPVATLVRPPSAIPTPQPMFSPLQPPPVVPVRPPVQKPVAPPIPVPSPRVEPPPVMPVPPPTASGSGEIAFKPASFFRRTIAFLVDCGILFLPLLVFYLVGALAIEIPDAIRTVSHENRMESWEHLEQSTESLALLIVVGSWLYAAGLESSRRQATVGKRWLGLKVTDAQGQRLTFLRATGRYAAKYLSALPCFLGFIMALFGSSGRALHDRLADTCVVSD